MQVLTQNTEILLHFIIVILSLLVLQGMGYNYEIRASKDFQERVQKRRVYSVGQTPAMTNIMSDGQSMSDPYDQVSDNPNPMRRKRQATALPGAGKGVMSEI